MKRFVLYCLLVVMVLHPQGCSAPPQCIQDADCGTTGMCEKEICKKGYRFSGKISEEKGASESLSANVEIKLFWNIFYDRKILGYIFGQGKEQDGRFSVQLTGSLPNEALNQPKESPFGLAYIYMYSKDKGPREGKVNKVDWPEIPLGLSETHVFVYKSPTATRGKFGQQMLRNFPIGYSCGEVIKADPSDRTAVLDSLKPVPCEQVVIRRLPPKTGPTFPNLW